MRSKWQAVQAVGALQASRGGDRGRADKPVRRMGTEVIADRRTRRERDRGASDRAEIERGLGDVMWYATGRVPGPWRNIDGGPFETASQAWEWARNKHLGGIRVYSDSRATDRTEGV